MTDEAKLAPPGAGLPPLERWFANTVLQALRGALSKDALTGWLRRETETALALAASLPEALVRQPVLVPRLTGLEDSSRNWSAAMVIQHLVIVDSGIGQLAAALSSDTPFERVLRIAEVKPDAAAGEEQQALLRAAVDDYAHLIGTLGDLRTSRRHAHPWFGMLDLRGWHTLAALHTTIHRRQIQRIVALLQ